MKINKYFLTLVSNSKPPFPASASHICSVPNRNSLSLGLANDMQLLVKGEELIHQVNWTGKARGETVMNHHHHHSLSYRLTNWVNRLIDLQDNSDCLHTWLTHWLTEPSTPTTNEGEKRYTQAAKAVGYVLKQGSTLCSYACFCLLQTIRYTGCV